MSIDTLLTLVELYKEAAQLIEAAQTEQETLKAQIKEALAERATNYLEVGYQDCGPGPLRSVQQNRHRPAFDHQLRKAPYSAHRPKFALYRALYTRRGGMHL